LHTFFNIQTRGSLDDTQVAAGDPQGTEREEVHIPLVEAENQGTEVGEAHILPVVVVENQEILLEVLHGNSALHNFEGVALAHRKAGEEAVVLHTDLDCKGR